MVEPEVARATGRSTLTPTSAKIDFAVLHSLKVCREVGENRARSGR